MGGGSAARWRRRWNPAARREVISSMRCSEFIWNGSVGSKVKAIGALQQRGDARNDLRLATGVLPGNWMVGRRDVDPSSVKYQVGG